MRIVIGVSPGESSDDALALGGLLCQAFSATPILAHIHPAAYDYASPGHVDAEWENYLITESRTLLDNAVGDAVKYGITDPAVMKKIDAALDSLEMAGILPPDEHEQAPAKPDAKLDGMISGAMTKAGM